MARTHGRGGAGIRKTNKKGATKGSGGQRRKGLEGKGPTPRAENRVGHPKARAKARRDRRLRSTTLPRSSAKASSKTSFARSMATVLACMAWTPLVIPCPDPVSVWLIEAVW